MTNQSAVFPSSLSKLGLALILFAIRCGLANPTPATGSTVSINLALGQPCQTFSSYEGSGWTRVALTDGAKTGIGWSSGAFTKTPDHRLYPEFVVVDLGTNARVHKVKLYPRTDPDWMGCGFPQDFSIQLSREGEPWKTVIAKTNYPAPTDGFSQEFTFPACDARFVKVEATRLRSVARDTYYFQLAEVEVFGIPNPPKPLKIDPAPVSGITRLIRLRAEDQTDPVGIDAERPHLSWAMESPVRGQKQTAYRILVASSMDQLDADDGNRWDSGKVTSDCSVDIPYSGGSLRSDSRYFWKVMVWDKNGQPLSWSKPATFVTGKLKPEDWQGHWIGASEDTHHAAVYLRKEITVDKPVKRALVFFCGLGYSELYIEGRKIGDYVLGPGFTTYDKRTEYLAFDVTDQFATPGRKTLAAILADGWYGVERDPWVHKFEERAWVDRPKLLLDLQIEYSDGSRTTIISDENWKWNYGEITHSWIAQENIDKRKAQPGWDRTGFDEKDWHAVSLVKGPAGKLVCQKGPPSRIIGEVHPVSLKYDPNSHKCTFDLGHEVTGWVRFRTRGQAGAALTLTAISDDGHARASDFTLAGTGGYETYEPRFFYVAMQKVEVSGLPEAPTLDDLAVCQVSSGWQRSGDFKCSDGVQNWLYDTTLRTVVNYTTWLPNDPVREWKAWVQDIQNMFVSSVYLFDSQTLYRRWQWDMMDCQRADGNCTQVAPGGLWDEYNSPWWGGCIAWLPWHWYLYYGDASLLEQSYPAMKRYVDYLQTTAQDGLQDWGLLDWLPVEETPRPIINTPAYYLFAQIVSRTAEHLGRTQEAKQYADLANQIRDGFNRKFLDRNTGIYGELGWVCRLGNFVSGIDTNVPHRVWWTGDRPCTQAGQTLPLALDMVPQDARKTAEQALLKEIKAHDDHVSSGFVTTPYLLQLLADLAPEAGRAMTSAQDYPSWYAMTAGTDHDLMKETWQGGWAMMPSLGGTIVAWDMQSLAGIRPDPGSPGFKKIIIKPNLVSSLHWVEGYFDSVHGRIVSNWRKRQNQLVMEVTIPANTTATVFIPAKNPQAVTEGRKPAAKAQGLKFLKFENGRAVFEADSGEYHFASHLP